MASPFIRFRGVAPIFVLSLLFLLTLFTSGYGISTARSDDKKIDTQKLIPDVVRQADLASTEEPSVPGADDGTGTGAASSSPVPSAAPVSPLPPANSVPPESSGSPAAVASASAAAESESASPSATSGDDGTGALPTRTPDFPAGGPMYTTTPEPGFQPPTNPGNDGTGDGDDGKPTGMGGDTDSGSGTGTGSGAASGGLSTISLVAIAIAIIAPALLIYTYIRRRRSLSGFQNMPPAPSERNTYHSTRDPSV